MRQFHIEQTYAIDSTVYNQSTIYSCKEPILTKNKFHEKSNINKNTMEVSEHFDNFNAYFISERNIFIFDSMDINMKKIKQIIRRILDN